MNGLDMLNTTPGGVAAGAAVARSGDAGPDDPGGDASRSFNALLAAFDEPTVTAEGPAQSGVPVFAPPAVALRQTLQITLKTAAGNVSDPTVDLSSQTDGSATAEKKTSTSDDLALTDLVGDAQTPAAPSQADAAPSLQAAASWSAAVSGAVGLMPALAGVVTAPAPVSPRQPDAPARSDPRLAADSTMTDGLSADVGRLLDAAAGATEAVLSNGAGAHDDLILSANVTVLRTETHLPPVTPTTPLHQVLAAITTDALAAPAEPAAAGAPDPTTTAGPGRQLVRTLDIRLEPPDLGSVTVKLRLSGEHLTLRISADSAATAQSLEQDRDTLASMLRSNGYSPEISAVRHEPAAATAILNASSTDAASSQSGAYQSGSQGSTGDGARSQSGQPGSQQQPQPGAAGFELTDGHDADVQDTAARSGLYL